MGLILYHILFLDRKTPKIDIFDISEKVLAGLVLQTRRIAVAVDKAFEPDGVSIVQLNRSAAGQTVFHLHFHIIPRWNGGELKQHGAIQSSSKALEKNAQLIRKNLKE